MGKATLMPVEEWDDYESEPLDNPDDYMDEADEIKTLIAREYQ